MENENKQKLELNSVTKKVLVILGLALVLMVPLSQVENQIISRREHETVAQKEVAKGWGENVAFGSPVVSASERDVYPAISETTIEVDSKDKKRGVFRVPVYIATLKTKVTFSKPATKKTETPKDEKLSELDHLILPVKPIASIQSFKIKDLASGKELKAKLVDGGVRLSADELPNKDFFTNQLEIEVSARGTGPITYESNSDQDKVKMLGNWTKPKFVDEILPTETKLSSKGFEASWTLNALPKWEDGSREEKSIGLNHLWIGTDYSMIEKAVKYGILFIALTFILVFVVEFMSKAKIHPLQYGLIGLSISVFYLLLLAISESIGFDIAYLISSLAVTGLIVFYVRGFLNQKKFVRMILTEQLFLGIFFYILLSLEESAFLIGSLGLFIALSIFMTITRKFDWYSGSFKSQNESQA
jgi:inner membrane protein